MIFILVCGVVVATIMLVARNWNTHTSPEAVPPLAREVPAAADDRSAPLLGPISCALALLSIVAPAATVIVPLAGAFTFGAIALGRHERQTGFAWGGIAGGALVFVMLVASSAPSRPVATVQRDLHWQYFPDDDKVRGYTDHWASLDSPTEVALNAPYEGLNVITMLVTHVGIDGIAPVVRFQALKGQIECDDTGQITLRFEGESETTFFCRRLPDHGTETIEIDPKSNDSMEREFQRRKIDALIKDLGSDKPLWVELNFYGDPPQQVKFDTRGFDPKQAA